MQLKGLVSGFQQPFLRMHSKRFYRFGMAEQAINTIYLLGEQPDQLCNDIIKRFTRRVFAAEPKAPPQHGDGEEAREEPIEERNPGSRPASTDPEGVAPEDASAEKGNIGKSFQLSQLVFVVGHVAIKHIVYLELVERELKRRKDVTAKGIYLLWRSTSLFHGLKSYF